VRELLPDAERVAALLRRRGETVAVAESAAGGLIAAALLGLPGASAYFRGGAVLYTRIAVAALSRAPASELASMRGATEAWALFMARSARERFEAHWAVGESGAAGPTGNRYGDPPGHACLAVAGPLERARTIATGEADRVANMYAFARAALALLAETIEHRV
jgi:PncC family amidohydrolase